MKPNFTPGPWESLYDKLNNTFTIVKGDTILGTFMHEPEANLAIASPDLYEALVGSLENCGHDEFGIKDKDCLQCVNAKSALAKARGEK